MGKDKFMLEDDFKKFLEEPAQEVDTDESVLQEAIAIKKVVEEGMKSEFAEILFNDIRKKIEEYDKKLRSPLTLGGMQKSNEYTMFERGMLYGFEMALAIPGNLIAIGHEAEKIRREQEEKKGGEK